MSRFLLFLILAISSVTSASADQPTSVVSNATMAGSESTRSAYIMPCDSWEFNNDVRGYVCRYRSYRISVADMNDIRNIEGKMNQMSQKILELESRIQVLEEQ